MTRNEPLHWRPFVTLALILVVGWGMALRTWIPPRTRGADANPQAFSATRAARVLVQLMPEGRPRPSGSAENRLVRERIVDRLAALGYEAHRQPSFVCSAFRHYCGQITNILARKQGANGDRAVLLNAHYDTMPATPGASDCMAGVAALLETARALAAGPALDSDVIFLFTDGEEAGLLGATAFVDEHPWAGDVSHAINLEARGSAGPSAPAYTVGDDRELLSDYIRTARYPAPGSAYLAITRHLPLTNDLTVFDRLGVPGVTFGYARHPRHYHTPQDTIDTLSLRSLQQHGENALRLTRTLTQRSRTAKSVTDRNVRGTFVAIGPWGVAYSTRWALPLSLLACVLLVACGVQCRRTGRLRLVEVAIGVAYWPLALVVGFFGAASVNYVRRLLTEVPSGNVSSPMPTFVGFVFIGTAFAIWVALPLRRWLNRPGGWLGVWTCWAAVAVAVAALKPLAAYLLTVPALLAGVGGPAALRDDPSRGWVTEAARILPVAAAVAIWYPHLMLLVDLIGIGNLPPMAALATVAATGFAPLVQRGTGRFAVGLFVIAIALVGIGTRLPTFSADHPQYANLIYHLDADDGAAHWAVTGYPLPGSLEEELTFDGWAALDPWAPQSAGMVADALPLDLAPPTLVVARRVPLGPGYQVTGRLASPRGAPVVQLAFPASHAPDRVRIEGVVVPADSARYPLYDPEYRVFTVWTLPAAGVEVEFAFAGMHAVDFDLLDRSYDLPAAATSLVQARGARAVPSGRGDGTLVRRTVKILPP